MISYNIKFPLNDDSEFNTYFKTTKITKEAITSNLLLLLLTQKGERYYEPDYGTNLLKYIFEPNDDITIEDIEREIKKTVSLYIPNLKIKKIDFKRGDGEINDENTLTAVILFEYSEGMFSDEGKLELNF